MIKLIRCDERLIHGQCMQFIVSDYSIKKIIVVDDMTASNPILKSIFTSAAPKSIDVQVYSVSEAIDDIKTSLVDESSTLLLMKNPRTLVKLYDQIEDLPKSLNIGPQMAKNGIKCVDYAALHPEDYEACEKLVQAGIRVYFNAIGASGTTVEWNSISKT